MNTSHGQVKEFSHHTVVRCFSTRTISSMPSVSFVHSVVSVLMTIHRNVNTVKNYWLPKVDNYCFMLVYVLASSNIMEQSYNI